MLAFVFPGQGSQAVGMLSALAGQTTIVADTFAEASDAIDLDLWKLSQQGPEESLNSTATTQPALLAAGVAVYRAYLERDGKTPSLMAGHSLGEYAALVAAGTVSLAEATKLVRLRGQAMQAAVPAGTGAMAAVIGIDDDQVAAACEDVDGTVSAANLNAPGQVVIAGETQAVVAAGEAAKARGAKRVLPLAVSVPSHCALMRPAALVLSEALESVDFDAPIVPVIHNADVLEHRDAPEIRAVLARQLHDPVRWSDTIRSFVDRGVTSVVECGPGKVLTGLCRRIDRSLAAVAIGDADTLAKFIEEQ